MILMGFWGFGVLGFWGWGWGLGWGWGCVTVVGYIFPTINRLYQTITGHGSPYWLSRCQDISVNVVRRGWGWGWGLGLGWGWGWGRGRCWLGLGLGLGLLDTRSLPSTGCTRPAQATPAPTGLSRCQDISGQNVVR